MDSVLVLLIIIVTIGSFVDALVQPSTAYAITGKSKGLWAFLIFLFGLFAAIPYLIWVRPALVAAK